MPTLAASELKKKLFVVLDGRPYAVLEVTFAAPTARGASTMVKVRLKNVVSGLVLEKNVKSTEKFEEADVEKSAASFSYSDPAFYYFMDESTYEQFSLRIPAIGDLKGYIKEGTPLQVIKFNGTAVALELPVYVELTVTETEPSVKGNSAGSVLKQARLETGLDVKVPQYVKAGDLVRVNTETGEIAGRA